MKNLEFNILETARVNIISRKIWRGVKFNVNTGADPGGEGPNPPSPPPALWK